jgi:hypothetical protein
MSLGWDEGVATMDAAAQWEEIQPAVVGFETMWMYITGSTLVIYEL